MNGLVLGTPHTDASTGERWDSTEGDPRIAQAVAYCKAQLKGHDTSHSFCEDYGCSNFVELLRILEN